MKRPTPEQMRLAAEWLDANEAEDGTERADCVAVRDWLRSEADNAELRQWARELGVPVSDVRRTMESQ